MLKKVTFGTLIAIATLAAGAPSAMASPGNCDCEWVVDRNEFGDAIGGHWECPDFTTCQITVEP